MTNTIKHNSNKRVSALDTALKLLLSLWNKLKYYVGLILIDNIMRNIVAWYDKRHSKASPNRIQKETNEINRLEVELKNKSLECDRLQLKCNSKIKENEDLKQQLSDLKMSLDNQNQSFSQLHQDFAELVNINEALTNESHELRKHCLPASDVPSMIYFAQGDASGLWLRKVSTSLSNDHIYKITTNVGDTSECSFSPLIKTNLSEIITNRNITLIACEIISIAPASSSIEVIEEGNAVLENNRWKVTRKAKIKLI